MTSLAPNPLVEGFDAASAEQWRALVDKALKGGDFEKRMVARTSDGIRVEPLYTRAHALAASGAAAPGEVPFTRGTALDRSSLGWEICQFHADGDPAKANAAILEDLQGGANAIALHFADMGFGLPIDEAALAKSLDGVMLDLCPVILVAGEGTHAASRHLMAVWETRGIARDKRLGAFGYDPLGYTASHGSLGQPLAQALSIAGQLVKDSLSMPGVTALAADGSPYHAGGASEAEELAAVLATLVAYLRAAEAEGTAPGAALPKIEVDLAIDADQFLGMAKLRAARRLVWRVAEACGAGGAAGCVRFNAVTAWRMMAKRDPWTNILRTSMACAAAGLGGAHRVTVLPFTFALGQTDRFARRLARNIQLVLQEESSLGRVTDPAGGSWYVEQMTDELAAKAWALFQEIEAKGGMAAALEQGFVQERIAATAAVRAKSIATGRVELTGVSAFPRLGDDGISAEPWPRLTQRAPSGFQVKRLEQRRLAEPFEALRDASDAHKARIGVFPRVFMASLGPIIEHTLRSTWIKNYLASGGIEALTSDGFADAAEAAAAFKTTGATAACIASSDALYATHAEAAARALRAAGATHVLMAGRPGDREAALRAAGVDEFLFAGADAIATLSTLQSKLGVEIPSPSFTGRGLG